MLRVALTRLSKSNFVSGGGALRRSAQSILYPFLTQTRLFHATDPPNVNAVALQMINYALGLARSQKTDESYAQGLLILEQCLASQSQEGQHEDIEDPKAMVFLAVSTLLSERGKTDEAIQTLLRIQDLNSCSLVTRVAAIEALVGLNLELGLDDTSSVLVDNGLKRFEKEAQQTRDGRGSEGLNARAKAIKGLVELVRSDLDSGGDNFLTLIVLVAKTFFQGCEEEGCPGNAALSHGEFLHVKRDFDAAKELYQSIISVSTEKKGFNYPDNVSACNMISEEVLLAATCALGQLQSHVGNFGDAEGTLTKALKLAEEHFGLNHPKVGVVLTCIALMYRYKAISDKSSSLIIQEGLFRKALELLKAPPLQGDVGAIETVAKRDIVAVARGGYAEALCVQENRKPEGEKMKNWAEAAWRNRRLSLAEALDISEPSSKVPVIDTRICRAL
ncbi:hypothetical protein V2J09_010473 [Rumex salicifolius]